MHNRNKKGKYQISYFTLLHIFRMNIEDIFPFQFPFDSQLCPIKIGSWQQGSSRINFNVANNLSSISDYTENPVWKIIEASSTTQKSASRFKNSEANDFLFRLCIERKPLYYIINNMFSCIVINVITLFMFFIPFQLQATLCKLYFFLIRMNTKLRF